MQILHFWLFPATIRLLSSKALPLRSQAFCPLSLVLQVSCLGFCYVANVKTKDVGPLEKWCVLFCVFFKLTCLQSDLHSIVSSIKESISLAALNLSRLCIAFRTPCLCGGVLLPLWYCSVFHSYISSSMITFVLAFSVMCFQNTNTLARFIVGVAWVLCAVLVTWCIRVSWEETENSWLSLYKGIWKKFVEGAHSLVSVRCKSTDSDESVGDEERASVVESTPSAMKVKPSWFRRLKPQSSQPPV